MKKALITGITGQDGAYLAELLLNEGYDVYGAMRRVSHTNLERLEHLKIQDNIKFVPMEISEYESVRKAVESVSPDEVYNLAAQSFVGISFEQPLYTSDVTALGSLRILEVLRHSKPDTKFYQASSSEMFGKVRETPQNEFTPFHPRSPYATAKAFAHHSTVNYRESYNIFAACGILFNHESPLRGLEFVSRKITRGVARIHYGIQNKLVLGNLDARRDWGYAKEYVQAIYKMLQHSVPCDFVIATGQTHSIREFVEWAFSLVDKKLRWEGTGLDEKGYDIQNGKILVEVSEKFYRPAEVDLLVGDISRAKDHLHWEPKTSVQELVSLMMMHDLQLTMLESKGRIFA